MLNLGSVSFDLGPDTKRLRDSVKDLQAFGKVVDQTSQIQEKAAEKTASALRKQEKAAIDALNKTLSLNQQIRKVEGSERFAQRSAAAFRQLNDQLTRGELTTLQFQRAMAGFRTNLGNAQRAFKDYAQAVRGAHGHSTNYVQALQNIASTSLLVAGPLSGIATRVVALTSVIRRGGFAVAAFTAGLAAGTYTFLTFGKTVLEAGKQMNSFTSMLTAVEGSGAAAAATFARITEAANRTGNVVSELVTPYTRWEAAVAGTNLEGEKGRKIFEALSATATKLQLGQEQVQGVFKAFEQIISKGTVQAEELRGQLGDRLPGAFQIASRALGVTTVKLNEMLKKGQVISEDFLPKFTAELIKTFHIGTDPIDNYTASYNRFRTAIFEAKVALDAQLGLTNKVKTFYESMTSLVRVATTEFDTFRNIIVATTGALIALSATSIIGGIITVAKWVGRLAVAVPVLGTLLNLNPWVRALTLATTAIAGASAALGLFGKDIKVVKGNAAELGDVFAVVWSDITSSVSGITPIIGKVNKAFSSFFSSQTSNTSNWVSDLLKAAKDIANGFISAAEIIDITFAALWAKLKVGASNWVNEAISAWGLDWNPIQIDPKDLELIDTARDKIKKLQDQILSGEGYIDDVLKRANTRALSDQYSQYRHPFDFKVGDVDLSHLEKVKNVQKAGIELSDKEVKALERKFEAMKKIDDAIKDAKFEVYAKSQTVANEELARSTLKNVQEVRRYETSLRKAGVETDFIKAKTQELYRTLEKNDAIDRARKGVEALRDSLSSAFDTAGQSIVDGLFEGKNALESLRDVAKDVAKDIIKTYMQLAILNPIKNWLFGLNEPTISGGFLGNVAKLIVGGRNNSPTYGQVADPWNSMRPHGESWAGVGFTPQSTKMFEPIITEAIKSTAKTLPPITSAGSTNAVMDFFRGRGLPLQFAGNYQGGVDSRLTSILKEAALRSNYQVQAFSGYRAGDPRFHGKGLATDVNLIDALTGKALPNYQNAGSFRQYEQFAQIARQVQMEKFPELSDKFRWGGYFSGGKGKYGAMDLMHFDLGGKSMGGGSWENGLTSAQRKLWPDAKSIGMLSQNFKELETTTESFSSSFADISSKLGSGNKIFDGFNQSAQGAMSGLNTLGGGLDKFSSSLVQAAQQMMSSGGGGWLQGLAKAFGGLGGALGHMMSISPLATSTILGGGFGLFADGAAFGPSGVINTPTVFKYGGNKIGVAGENKEEGILPLARDSTGALGVKYTADRDTQPPQSGTVVNVINNGEPVDVQRKERTENGISIVDIILDKVNQSVVSDISSGGTALNKALESRYALRSARGLGSK